MTETENNQVWQEREQPAPWRCFGEVVLEAAAIDQMDQARHLPMAVRGALRPDAHTGYGLPIGGVLAVRKAVKPRKICWPGPCTSAGLKNAVIGFTS